MTTTGSPDGFWILAVGLLVVALWLPHGFYAIRLWRRERSARTFRNAFIAVMLLVGLSRGVLAGASRLWPHEPGVQAVNVILSPLIFLFLITGAIVAWWTWRHDAGRW